MPRRENTGAPYFLMGLELAVLISVSAAELGIMVMLRGTDNAPMTWLKRPRNGGKK